jgi:uncharacterized protein YndB with AHSA1/START domain
MMITYRGIGVVLVEEDRMTKQNVDDVIRYTEIVDVSPEIAFTAFVERFADWWPAVFTFSGKNLAWIGIEPTVGGRCLERDHQGNELVWGEVIKYEPGEQIVFSWWIQPDRTLDSNPDRASEIEVRFIDERALTRIEFEHRCLSRHRDGWEQMRQAMASREGWPLLLQLYSDFSNSPG